MMIQEKVPGGKLVCVEVESSGKRIEKIRITGDFFLYPEETLEKIERALTGAGIKDDLAKIVAGILSENNAQFIGVTPEDLERMIRKVVL